MIETLTDKCDLCSCRAGVCSEDAMELKEAEILIIEPRCTNCAKRVWSCRIEEIKFNKDDTNMAHFVLSDSLTQLIVRNYRDFTESQGFERRKGLHPERFLNQV